MHIADKFERLLDRYRRPDGQRWGGQDLHEATGGVVTRSYVSNLRKGRIENPGYEKMRAIAKAMGFPPEEWFRDGAAEVAVAGPDGGDADLAGRLEHLFDTLLNPATGGSYTNAEVARMSAGDLTEEDVRGIRTDEVANPTVGQVAALAAVFGVDPSYLVDRKEAPPLDRDLLDALRDGAIREAAREIARLPERERGIVLGVARQFGEARDRPEGAR
ncbi:MAG: helix-turn-helix domain-containing protein [Actinomycetota bacterium]|nr:helix-turn-helix domain-containing protein [Actinomycetota bacterium]